MFDSSVILVAECDERSRQFLAAQLAADGADVYLAEDTAQARARAATPEPQLVLLGCLGECRHRRSRSCATCARETDCTASPTPTCEYSLCSTTSTILRSCGRSTPAPTTWSGGAAIVPWLAHEDCSVTGATFVAYAGRIARIRIGEPIGAWSRDPTPEFIRDHLDDVESTDLVHFSSDATSHAGWVYEQAAAQLAS